MRKNSLYSLYSDSHLQLIITIWNHRLGRMRRAVPLPALSPQTIKLLRRASCYILCAASVCVLNTWICNQHILHILPLRCPANIKGGKGWFGISVCLCLPMYKTARLSAPRHRRGAAEEIKFHDYHIATWQVGLWFVYFVAFACTWLWADHTKCLFKPQDQIWKSLCQRSRFLWFFARQQREKHQTVTQLDSERKIIII